MTKSALKRTTRTFSIEQMKELIDYARSQHVHEFKVDEFAFRFSPTAFITNTATGEKFTNEEIAKKNAIDFDNLLFMSSR